MRAAAFALLAALLAACAPAPVVSRGSWTDVPLANPTFGNPRPAAGACPAGWYCNAHANGSHRYRMEDGGPAGRACLCTDRVLAGQWALLNQYVPAEALRGARVRLSVAMRVDAAATAPGAGPFLLAEALDSSTVLHEQALVNRTSGWQRVAVEGVVGEKAWRLQVGVLFDADGTACVDDMRLEVLAPA